MKMPMRSHVLSGILASFAAIATTAFFACVSDDGTNVIVPTDGGSNDASAGAVDGSNGVDASSPTDAFVPPPVDAGLDATPPRLLTNDAGLLAVWLEASSNRYVIDEDAGVATWTDVSGNHNDATSGNNYPLFYAQAVNNHAAVDFNGQNVGLDIPDAPSLQFGQDDVFIVAVVRQTTNQRDGFIWSKATYTPVGETSDYASGLELVAQTESDDAGAFVDLFGHTYTGTANQVDWGPAVFDNSFHRAGVRRAGGGGKLTLYVDDLPPVSSNIGTFNIDEVGNSVHIGGSPAYQMLIKALDIQIAELIALHAPNAPVTDQDVADVMTYLKAKYALP
jgi:hypothetical protein